MPPSRTRPWVYCGPECRRLVAIERRELMHDLEALPGQLDEALRRVILNDPAWGQPDHHRAEARRLTPQIADVEARIRRVKGERA